MKIEKKFPPYPQITWIANLMKTFGKMKLSKIESKTIHNYNITSPGNESKILSLLKFLEVTNEENDVNPENYAAVFSYSGEKKKEEFTKLIKKAYKELFDTIPSLKEANLDILRNFFISNYNYSGGLAEAATKVFIFLAKEAGISLSDDLTNKIELRKRKQKQEFKGKINRDSISNISFQKEKKQNKSNYDDGKIFLAFKMKNSAEMDFNINNLEDWEDARDFIEKKLNKIFNNQGLNASLSGTDK